MTPTRDEMIYEIYLHYGCPLVTARQVGMAVRNVKRAIARIERRGEE